MKLAIVIFIYERSSQYFNLLVDSINKQSFFDFEVIIFNDDVANPYKYFEKLAVKFSIINLPEDTPCGLRFIGLSILYKLGFDYFIFQDCDDELSQNRIEIISSFSDKYQIIVNDLDIISVSSEIIHLNIWCQRFDKSSCFTYKNIECYNFIGLGNTSIKRDLLRFVPQRPHRDIVAVDWYIFYSILRVSKIKGYFTSLCTTLYRQHFENTIGIADNTKIENIFKTKNNFFQLTGQINNIKNISNKKYILPTKRMNNFPFWWELNENTYGTN